MPIWVDVATEYGTTGSHIQTAINDAVAAVDDRRRTLYLSSRVWPITTKLTIPDNARPIRIIGARSDYDGSGGAILRATAPFPAGDPLLDIRSAWHVFEALKFDGARLVNDVVDFRSATGCVFERVVIEDAKRDGLHSFAEGINQSIRMTDCIVSRSGTFYTTPGITSPHFNPTQRFNVSGTASATRENATITITGGPNLVTDINPPVRKGDLIRVGSIAPEAFYGQIDHVTPNTVVLQGAFSNLPSKDHSGDWAIGVGDGWHEEPWARTATASSPTASSAAARARVCDSRRSTAARSSTA